LIGFAMSLRSAGKLQAFIQENAMLQIERIFISHPLVVEGSKQAIKE
jgi:hypothetical protein